LYAGVVSLAFGVRVTSRGTRGQTRTLFYSTRDRLLTPAAPVKVVASIVAARPVHRAWCDVFHVTWNVRGFWIV
jgi:hypothetical protein